MLFLPARPGQKTAPTVQNVYDLRSEHPVVVKGTVVKKEDAGGESPPIVAKSSSSAPTLQMQAGVEFPIDVRLAQAGLSIKLYMHQLPDLHALITGVEAIRTWL